MYRPAAPQKLYLAGLMTGLSCLLAGCMVETSRSSTWDNFASDWQSQPAQNTPSNRTGRRQNRAPQQVTTWSIPLQRYTGPHRYTNAQWLIQTLTQEHGLTQLSIQDAGGVSVVYAGRFESADDPAAAALLGRVQQIQLQGQQPFTEARLQARHDTGEAADPWDLAPHHGKYSLAIAFYDSAFDEERGRRQAAEDAVKTFRDDGFDAYYYHRPQRSYITIGLWDEHQAFTEEIDTSSGETTFLQVYSPQVLAMQERFPNLLGNGVTIELSMENESLGRSESFLFQVAD